MRVIIVKWRFHSANDEKCTGHHTECEWMATQYRNQTEAERGATALLARNDVCGVRIFGKGYHS